jgi:hypothetical protein
MAKSTPARCNTRAMAREIFFPRSSKEPAQPTNQSRSASGLIAHQGHIHIPAPVGPAVGGEPPGVGLVLEVAEGLLNLLGESGFHEHLKFARFDDEVQLLDVHRTTVFAGPAGGAGPQARRR